jgi:hypothetical protein
MVPSIQQSFAHLCFYAFKSSGSFHFSKATKIFTQFPPSSSIFQSGTHQSIEKLFESKQLDEITGILVTLENEREKCFEEMQFMDW